MVYSYMSLKLSTSLVLTFSKAKLNLFLIILFLWLSGYLKSRVIGIFYSGEMISGYYVHIPKGGRITAPLRGLAGSGSRHKFRFSDSILL